MEGPLLLFNSDSQAVSKTHTMAPREPEEDVGSKQAGTEDRMGNDAGYWDQLKAPSREELYQLAPPIAYLHPRGRHLTQMKTEECAPKILTLGLEQG